jgi:hypothetical protein
MAVPTWPLWLGVIFITGAQLTLENAANSSPPRKGEAIAFGCSALLLRGRRVGVLPKVGTGAASRPKQVPLPCSRRTPSFPYGGGSGSFGPQQRQSAWADFGLQGSPRGLTLRLWSLSRPPNGHCALMVEIAGTSPAMTESAATSFAPVTSCRIFGWSAFAVETTRPSLDVLIRRGMPTTVGKARFGEDGKVYPARLFGDFSRSKRVRYTLWWCFDARALPGQIGSRPTSVIVFLYVIFLTHAARHGQLQKQSFQTRKRPRIRPMRGRIRLRQASSARSDFSVRPNPSSLGCVPWALGSEPTATGLSWALSPERARPVSALPCGLPG